MEKNMKLEEYDSQLAWMVHNDVKIKARKDEYKIDPLTVITIISLILEVVKWFIKNYGDNPEKLAESFGNMNLVQKWIVWRCIRRESDDRQEARYIYDSLVKLSEKMSLEDRVKLFTLKESEL